MPMPPFQGSITALITPFKQGKIDSVAFQSHVEWQIDQGTHGLVPVGTTGESPTLSHEEHKRVIELCIEAAARRVPVIAGTGSNCTEEAVALTRHAKDGGRRRRARGDALLQQADAGGALPAFQGDQRLRRHSDRHLQHPRPQRRRHVGRDHGAPRQAPQHRGREGRHREHGAREPAARGDRQGFHPALGRRRDRARLHGPWRAGLHLGHRQCRAVALLGIPARLSRRQFQARARAAGPADAAARRLVRGVQSRTGEICRREARPVRSRDAAAAWRR